MGSSSSSFPPAPAQDHRRQQTPIDRIDPERTSPHARARQDPPRGERRDERTHRPHEHRRTAPEVAAGLAPAAGSGPAPPWRIGRRRIGRRRVSRHPFRALAPRITGSPACQESAVASARANPRPRAAVRVAPLRDTPGISASACAIPSASSPSTAGGSRVSSGGGRHGAVFLAGGPRAVRARAGHLSHRAPFGDIATRRRAARPRSIAVPRDAPRSCARTRIRRAPRAPARGRSRRRPAGRGPPRPAPAPCACRSRGPPPRPRGGPPRRTCEAPGRARRRAGPRARGPGSCGPRRRPAAARSAPGALPARGPRRKPSPGNPPQPASGTGGVSVPPPVGPRRRRRTTA